MACQEKFRTGNEVPDEGGASVQDEEDEEGRRTARKSSKEEREKTKNKEGVKRGVKRSKPSFIGWDSTGDALLSRL